MGVEGAEPSLEEIADLVESNIEDCVIGPFGFHHPNYMFFIKLEECSEEDCFEYIRLFRGVDASGGNCEPTYRVQASNSAESWRRGILADYRSRDEGWNGEAGRKIEGVVENLISKLNYERVLEVMVPGEEEFILAVRENLCWRA